MAIVVPKISIVTPSYNQGAFIEETIQSVISQEYPEVEFIVIDGGSNDETTDILQRYQQHFHYWVSEKDSGQSDAINKGLGKSTGDLLTWLCSDDLLAPGTLHRVAELYRKHPQAGLFHGRSKVFGKGRKETTVGAPAEDLSYRYLAGIPFPQPSSFFTRKAFEHCGPLDTTLHYGMDFAFFQRIALAFEIIADETVWSNYRIHPGSKTSSQLIRFSDDWIDVFSRFLKSLSDTKALQEKLEAAGYFHSRQSAIEHNRKFTQREIVRITCLFLLDQFRIRYEVLDRSACLKLIRLIRSLDAGFAKTSDLDRLELQLRYIPEKIYLGLRRLTR